MKSWTGQARGEGAGWLNINVVQGVKDRLASRVRRSEALTSSMGSQTLPVALHLKGQGIR